MSVFNGRNQMMEGQRREFRPWNKLIPDVLALIFTKLSFQEILTVIPSVCKPWGEAVSGPYCWEEINLLEWSRGRKPKHINRMLRILITRSSSSLRKLSVPELSNDSIFSFIADHAGSLQALRLPRSKISDSIVEQLAGKLSIVTFLDISCCIEVGSRALEAIGKNCKSLVRLRRLMHPLYEMKMSLADDEAYAVAATMPKLKHLEFCFQFLTTEGVMDIISRCQELEFLDVRGCWYVNIDKKSLKEKYPALKIKGPDLIDCHGIHWSGSGCDSSYFVWLLMLPPVADFNEDTYHKVFQDKQRHDEVELGFSEGLEHFGWPSSP